MIKRTKKTYSLSIVVAEKIEKVCPVDVPESRFVDNLLKEALHIK